MGYMAMNRFDIVIYQQDPGVCVFWLLVFEISYCTIVCDSSYKMHPYSGSITQKPKGLRY